MVKVIKKIIFLILILSVFNGVNTVTAEEKILHGFFDYRVGSRVSGDLNESNEFTLNEVRSQFQLNKAIDVADFQFKGDVIYDDTKATTDIDLREAYIMLDATDSVEIKAGRQVNTWGTGRYIFINDLFPKDWQSFFIGRDDEYLKNPSNSIKVSYYPEIFDVDVVATPFFTPDNFITGERISYFNTLTGKKGGDINQIDSETPDKNVRNIELATRINKNLSGIELALYGYRGFHKRPLGFDGANNKYIFPKLNVLGLSFRTQALGGVLNSEAGYYDSQNDKNGKNPLIENSEFKFLVGFQKELFKDFSFNMQYYLELMMDYNDYKLNFPANPNTRRDEARHLLTFNFTKLSPMQRLRLTLFAFYSPTDNDVHLRPLFSYKWTDEIKLVLGSNIFFGENDHTFFGQLADNTNVYLGVRYGF